MGLDQLALDGNTKREKMSAPFCKRIMGNGEAEMLRSVGVVRRNDTEGRLGGARRSSAPKKQQDLTAGNGKSTHTRVTQQNLETENPTIKLGRTFKRTHIQRAFENPIEYGRPGIHAIRTGGPTVKFLVSARCRGSAVG